MTLTAAFHVNHAEHQRLHGEAMRDGLARHGIRCEFHPYDQPAPCDFAVTWGYRQSRVIAAGRPLLVMERGHLPDRFAWTSVGWATTRGGIGRRARYAEPADHGQRFQRHWGHLLQLWRPWPMRRNALLCGQVPGDAALDGKDMTLWAQETADELRRHGWTVSYRPHPLQVRRGDRIEVPFGSVLSRHEDLATDLRNADLIVTWNSTAGVESVLAGVPTVAQHEGSMAWDVAAHAIPGALGTQPPRIAWAHCLAWCQWSLDEIRDGTAWAHVRDVAPF